VGAPQTLTLQRFGYTAPDATVTGVQSATWVWSGRGRAVSMFCAFDPGNGPASGTYIVFVSKNGTHAGSITVPQGDDEAVATIAPVMDLVVDDLVTFDISQVSGATGAVTFGFNYY
jgi:hypothetical protein